MYQTNFCYYNEITEADYFVKKKKTFILAHSSGSTKYKQNGAGSVYLTLSLSLSLSLFLSSLFPSYKVTRIQSLWLHPSDPLNTINI
jgi:hypothetical protein